MNGWTASDIVQLGGVNSDFAVNTFYITGMEMSCTVDQDVKFKIKEENGNQIIVYYATALNTNANRLVMNFDVPVPFDTQRISIQPYDPVIDMPLAITGILFINLYGYLEAKT